MAYCFNILTILFIFFSSMSSHAKEQGHGRVGIGGSIVETPCAIDTQSRDQSIDMGATPMSNIARDGQGDARNFSVLLVNCTLHHVDITQPDWRYFEITFEGRDERGLFGVNGNAEGVALQLRDSKGHLSKPGVPLPIGELTPGNIRLNYTLQLISNNKNLRSGDFSSSISFKMNYY